MAGAHIDHYYWALIYPPQRFLVSLPPLVLKVHAQHRPLDVQWNPAGWRPGKLVPPGANPPHNT